MDPTLKVVKAVDKLAGNENQFVIPDNQATDIAIITKSESIDPEPIILQKTDDATTAVVMQDGKVITTQFINDEIQNDVAMLFGSTYYADDDENIEFNAAIISDQSADCKVVGRTLLSELAYNSEDSASKTADLIKCTNDNFVKAIDERGFSTDSNIEFNVDIAIDSSTPEIEISSTFFNELAKNEKSDISISAKTNNADVYLNPAAVKELGELSEGKAATILCIAMPKKERLKMHEHQ